MHRPSTLHLALVLWCALVIIASACGPAPTDQQEPAGSTGWECSSEREGQERCDGDSVIWCHAVSHGEFGSAHFHEGARCGDRGMSCVEAVEGIGFCLDEATPCEQETGWCQERFAYNCVDGMRAEKRCSLAQQCALLDSGQATCQPLPGSQDTQQ